uniref:PET domain-containing protein n=1 Tax=Plectus sambesii TaxID=2011161 RepID=A0A914VZF5_9BILA
MKFTCGTPGRQRRNAVRLVCPAREFAVVSLCASTRAIITTVPSFRRDRSLASARRSSWGGEMERLERRRNRAMEESNRFRMDEVPAAHINPQIFKLEHKPKTVLAHEIGAGSPCLNCKDDCPGLDLHFWRKICKVCKCRVDDHDVQLQEYDHGKIIIGRLIDPKTMLERQAKISNSQPSMSTKVNIGSPRKHTPNFDVKIRSTTGRSGVEASTQYTWVPTMDAEMIDKYMKMIPEEERPIAGTEGAQCRRKRLAFQLPYHDCDPDAAQSTATAAERDAHHKFIATIKEKVVGMGHIVEWDEQIVRQSLRHNEECHGRQLNNGDGSAAKVGKHVWGCAAWGRQRSHIDGISPNSRLSSVLYRQRLSFISRPSTTLYRPWAVGASSADFSRFFLLRRSSRRPYPPICLVMSHDSPIVAALYLLRLRGGVIQSVGAFSLTNRR